ncbi:MAG: hypothetical protein OHK0029_02960 [Armatimonadaceae bacterium]
MIRRKHRTHAHEIIIAISLSLLALSSPAVSGTQSDDASVPVGRTQEDRTTDAGSLALCLGLVAFVVVLRSLARDPASEASDD